jgi:hypothetical protein
MVSLIDRIANFVSAIAPTYGIPVVLHTDHVSPRYEYSQDYANGLIVRQEAPPMVGRNDGRGRSLLQGEGRASVFIAHGRLVRRVRRLQHTNDQEVPHSCIEDEANDRDGDWHHRRRGRWCQQRGCRQRFDVHSAGGQYVLIPSFQCACTDFVPPRLVWAIYKELSEVSDLFSIAAGFGNVHGVYKPGNVKVWFLFFHDCYIAKI